MTDHEKYKWIKDNLYVPVVCDILDQLGYRHQAMHQRLRPLDETCCVFVGRARTFRWLETDYVVQDNPYGRCINATGDTIAAMMVSKLVEGKDWLKMNLTKDEE